MMRQVGAEGPPRDRRWRGFSESPGRQNGATEATRRDHEAQSSSASPRSRHASAFSGFPQAS
jgi:hypothetical protein